MMIAYKGFAFASPPRTASTWFIKAASSVGLGDAQKVNIHRLPPSNWNGFLTSLVRHPYDWLVSYYLSLEGGVIGVPCVDQFVDHARASIEVYGFINRYLQTIPGAVGKMFDDYQATSVMRLEDLPWAAVEFFQSVGIDRKVLSCLQYITPQNTRKGHPHIVDKNLRRKVVEAERDFCDRYEYY